MSKMKKEPEQVQVEEKVETAQEPEAETKTPESEKKEPSELEKALAAQAKEHDQYLRLAAEFDNFRKRSVKEKDGIYQEAKAETAKKFLPVYDNLERALKNETADEAYKKGVEMTMTQLKEVLSKLGVTEIPALGEKFDPEKHNAVMHTEDDTAEENTVVEVFQKGYTLGDKVLRFAMVKVAN